MTTDREPLLDPSDALRVLAAQEAETQRQLTYPDHLTYPLWGAVYLLGYLPLALSRGPHPLVAIPVGLALGWFFALLIAGIVTSTALSIRMGRGLRGASSSQGALFGYAWALAFLALAGAWYRLGVSVSDDDATGMLTNGLSMIVVGILFMAGGAIWLDIAQFVVGAAVCVVTGVALVLGFPAYYWVLSLVIGGGFLLVGLVRVIQRGNRVGAR